MQCDICKKEIITEFSCSYCQGIKCHDCINKCSVCNAMFICSNCLVPCFSCKQDFCAYVCQNTTCEKCFAIADINYCAKCMCACPETKVIENFF